MRRGLIFVLLFSALGFLTQPALAGRDRLQCPVVWVVSYENTSSTGRGGVEIADGFPSEAGCVVERHTTTGASARVALREESVQFDVKISRYAVCVEKNPCTVVVGVRVPTCEDVSTLISRVDGTLTTTVKKTRTTDGKEDSCETEVIVAGYIYHSPTDEELRTLRGQVALAYLSNLPERPVVQP